MEVEVENRTKIKADITTDQIRKYLLDNGWEIFMPGHIWEQWSKDIGYEAGVSIPMREDYNDFAECLSRTIFEISLSEKRQPGDILLDIAKIRTNTEEK